MAARLQPDGGMPGTTMEERIAATVDGLMRFLEEGHTPKRGAFRSHVLRMVQFLERLSRPELGEVLEAVRAGRVLPRGKKR